jgi:hypothetical protein
MRQKQASIGAMRVILEKGIKKRAPCRKDAEKQKAIIADGLLSLNLMVPGVGLEPTRLFIGGF